MEDLIDTDEILIYLSQRHVKTKFIYSIHEEEWIDGEFTYPNIPQNNLSQKSI